MVILGLTGSIGMGKTTAALGFRRLGIPVYDADQAVHALIGRGGSAVGAVEAAFPGVVRDGAVDRNALAARVFEDAGALARLEGILHPRVREAQRRFLKRAAARKTRVVVLDIPLLFESGGSRLCDAVVVVTAPAFLQKIRVMLRAEMTEDKLTSILARQMSDREKRARADFVVQTGLDRGYALRRIRKIAKVAERLTSRNWPPRPINRAMS